MITIRAVATLLVASVAAAFSAVPSTADAREPLQPRTASAAGTWSSWGGEAVFQFNPDRLRELGITVRTERPAEELTRGAPGLRYHVVRVPAANAGALEFAVDANKPRGLRGGSLQYRGGFVFEFDGGEADLRALRIESDGKTEFGMNVVDAQGNVWLQLDHIHFNLVDGNTVFRLRDMNARLSPHFANVLGHPEWKDIDIGGADIVSNVRTSEESPEGGVCASPFPTPGLLTDILVFYGTDTWVGTPDRIVAKRCTLPGGGACTAASTNGNVVISPDSSLRNVGQTAVTWHEMFTGNFPPYGNDQHPFLVWNMYRRNADGTIKQIGVSGVKHAFETVNWNCSCTDPQVIYPTCEDTYSTNNNDGSIFLGPRRELIPATAQWGRCGSVFDTNCDGTEGPGGGATNLHEFRLNAVESDMLPAMNPGATYFFEYWYVVRDDQNIYNTMGYREIVPTKTGTVWTAPLTALPDFTLGPYINAWVDPASPPAGTANNELVTSEGRARVAVKTSSLGGGLYRYEYAVMNFDFARAVVDGATAEPNLRVLSNTGFGSFSVPLATGATLTNVSFLDTDITAANDWTMTSTGGRVTWTAPAGNELNWGTMYRFAFTSNVAPLALNAGLGVATAGTPASYFAPTLAPQVDLIFADGFGP